MNNPNNAIWIRHILRFTQVVLRLVLLVIEIFCLARPPYLIISLLIILRGLKLDQFPVMFFDISHYE